jgi:hypothetical protein
MVKLQYVIPPVNFPKPAPPKSDASQQAANNNGDASNKDGMWKDSVSGKDDHTTSVENIGNEKMPTNLNSLGVWGQGTTQADAEWHAAQIGDVNYQSSGDWGSAYAVGSTDFLKLEGRVYGDSGYKDGTVMASGGVQGRFELIGSHYQAGYTSPTAFTFGGHDFNSRTTLNGDASVGAAAIVNGGIALGKNDYVDVGASGFAGASASLKGSESIGDVATVKGDATVWAGVGAKANLDAGYKDGELSFSFGFGFAFGYGFDYDLGFSINVGAVGDCIEEGASDVVDGIGDAASAVGDAMSSLF